MNSDKNIKNLISSLHDTTTPDFDNKVRNDILLTFEKSKTQSAHQPNFWRLIMNYKLTKFAAAAVMIVTIGLLSYYHTGSVDGTSRAWATDQTFKALDQIKTAFAEGKDPDGRKFMAWIEVDPNGFITKWRIETPEIQCTLISTPLKSYQYNKNGNRVITSTGPIIQIGMRVRALFEEMQDKNCTVSSIIRDGQTVLLCTFNNPKGQTIVEVDPITKLPIRMQINEPVRPGMLFKEVDTIHYNVPLPENIFDFKIEHGMNVMDGDAVSAMLHTTENGIMVEDSNDMAGAKYIAEEYCKAVFEQNTALGSKLNPTSHDYIVKALAEPERGKLASYKVYPPRIEAGCGFGPVVRCEVRYENGTGKKFNIIVQFFNERTGKRGVIAGWWDGFKELK